jgi:hypothetical protein
MARPFSGVNAGTDDTNDFQIEIVPADGTNAAANCGDFGISRWQFIYKMTPNSVRLIRAAMAGCADC